MHHAHLAAAAAITVPGLAGKATSMHLGIFSTGKFGFDGLKSRAYLITQISEPSCCLFLALGDAMHWLTFHHISDLP